MMGDKGWVWTGVGLAVVLQMGVESALWRLLERMLEGDVEGEFD